MTRENPSKLLLISLVFSLLASCSSPAPTKTPVPTEASTQTPALPLLILLVPPGSDINQATIAAEISADYAGTHGMQFDQRAQLNPSDLPPSLAKLVILGPDPGATALAEAAPQAQVIAVGISSDVSIPNLVSLPLGSTDNSAVAFVAGYVAAISADDWRTGILFTAAYAGVVNDFTAGVKYFCGSCIPMDPPLNSYPAAAQAGDAQNWQSAADELVAQQVKVVFLTPDLETSGAAQYLANSGVFIIGTGTPPSDLSGSWLVSISSDAGAALHQLLPQALDGQPLTSIPTISFSNADADLFTESRQRFVQPIIDDLSAGYIQPPTD